MGQRGRLVPLVLVVLVLITTACGEDTDSQAQVSGIDEPAYVGISGVAAADGRTLTVLTGPIPAPSATGRCAVTVKNLVETHAAWVSVNFEVAGAERPFEGCDPRPRQMEVTLPEPLGDRRVIDPFGSSFRLVDGSWVGCASVVVECITQSAACEGSTLQQTVANLDVPRGADLVTIGCQEPWAIVDVDLNGGACPESGDGVPSCAPARMRRFFLRIEGTTWTHVGSWQEAGCDAVQGSVPAFPTELCEELSALP